MPPAPREGTAGTGRGFVLQSPVLWSNTFVGEVLQGPLTNFVAGALDGTNAVPVGSPDDVSFALGRAFTLAADETATLHFRTSLTPPAGGSYLVQTDPDSASSVYFSSDLTIGGEDAAQGADFGRISGLAADASGRIFVADAQDVAVSDTDAEQDLLFRFAPLAPGYLAAAAAAGIAGVLWYEAYKFLRPRTDRK